MAGERGDVFTITALAINNAINAAPEAATFESPDPNDCCFILQALADTATDEAIKNDFWRFHKGYEISTTDVDMFLIDPLDSTFTPIALTDDTYGTFYEFGYFVDGVGRSYVSYELDFKKVLTVLGAGTYQIKAVESMIVGADLNTFDFAFCVAQYTAKRADKTIRLQFSNSGTITDRFNEAETVSFPSNFNSQLRVWGFFGKDNSEYVIERTKYNNKKLIDISNKRTPKYSLSIRQVPQDVHDFISINVLQSEQIEISDYNRNNSKRHINTAVSNPGAYNPEDNEINLLKSVKVELESRYDTGTKEFCKH
jgi:hypothetical protein